MLTDQQKHDRIVEAEVRIDIAYDQMLSASVLLYQGGALPGADTTLDRFTHECVENLEAMRELVQARLESEERLDAAMAKHAGLLDRLADS